MVSWKAFQLPPLFIFLWEPGCGSLAPEVCDGTKLATYDPKSTATGGPMEPMTQSLPPPSMGPPVPSIFYRPRSPKHEQEFFCNCNGALLSFSRDDSIETKDGIWHLLDGLPYATIDNVQSVLPKKVKICCSNECCLIEATIIKAQRQYTAWSLSISLALFIALNH